MDGPGDSKQTTKMRRKKLIKFFRDFFLRGRYSCVFLKIPKFQMRCYIERMIRNECNRSRNVAEVENIFPKSRTHLQQNKTEDLLSLAHKMEILLKSNFVKSGLPEIFERLNQAGNIAKIIEVIKTSNCLAELEMHLDCTTPNLTFVKTAILCIRANK